MKNTINTPPKYTKPLGSTMKANIAIVGSFMPVKLSIPFWM
jgi:hypothetical protein